MFSIFISLEFARRFIGVTHRVARYLTRLKLWNILQLNRKNKLSSLIINSLKKSLRFITHCETSRVLRLSCRSDYRGFAFHLVLLSGGGLFRNLSSKMLNFAGKY